ncbi:MAG TPA: radical SAM protein [Acidimicrobiia bacterium]|jgi:DNA repair photolyase|nr:radical SAM protein [Acidimicrobiia bacterium]
MAENLRWKLADQPDAQPALFAPARRVAGRGEYRGLEFLEVDAKSIINKVPGGPRFGFEYTINAYRGCSHRCTYCFARPTHEYLGLGIGEDFDRKIVVKRNAVDLVRAETAPTRWGGDLIAMGTNTDPYQPAEGKYRLTRGVLEVLGERGNPVSILTKSTLVLRDLDVLQDVARAGRVRVDFSVGTLDPAVWKLTEPGTPHPQRRIDAVAELNETGIRSGILMGPIIPGLSDGADQIRDVVRAAVAAGAVGVGHVVLHLGPGIRDHFLQWLERHRPHLASDHGRWYGGGREASSAIRARIAATVDAALREFGGPVPDRVRRSARVHVRTAAPASPQQLGLGL